MEQGVILTYMTLLKICISKTIVATSSGLADKAGLSKLKSFWKGITIQDAMKNIYDSWEKT